MPGGARNGIPMRASRGAPPPRPHRPLALLALLPLALTLALALAGGGGGGGSEDGGGDGGGGGGSSGGRSDYDHDLRRGSYADAYYQVWRCATPRPGTYTTALAEAATDSWPSKSRYLAHNARLYLDEPGSGSRQRDRSDDVVREVPDASGRNYITSLPPAVASYELSCPRAVLATIRAETWHKGVSIHGERESFYKSDAYYGQ